MRGMRHADIFRVLRVKRHPCKDAPMPTETEALIGTAEAARILGKSPRTVHRLVAAGRLVPAIVAPGGFAGSYLFRREDVEALASEVAA